MINIEINKTENGEYITQIKINSVWYKEIGGFSNISDLLKIVEVSLNEYDAEMV